MTTAVRTHNLRSATKSLVTEALYGAGEVSSYVAPRASLPDGFERRLQQHAVELREAGPRDDQGQGERFDPVELDRGQPPADE